jgi:hypothetical protein
LFFNIEMLGFRNAAGMRGVENYLAQDTDGFLQKLQAERITHAAPR